MFLFFFVIYKIWTIFFGIVVGCMIDVIVIEAVWKSDQRIRLKWAMGNFRWNFYRKECLENFWRKISVWNFRQKSFVENFRRIFRQKISDRHNKSVGLNFLWPFFRWIFAVGKTFFFLSECIMMIVTQF